MAALGKQLGKVPDDAVRDLVAWFVPRSEELGGTGLWFGKRVQLSSRLRRQRHTRAQRSSNSVVLGGTPAGLWAIKSYGRIGDYDVVPRRAPALALSNFVPGVFFERVHVQRAVAGDGRWDRLVREADAKFPDVVAELVDRAVR